MRKNRQLFRLEPDELTTTNRFPTNSRKLADAKLCLREKKTD